MSDSSECTYLLLNRQRKHAIKTTPIRQFMSALAAQLGKPGTSFTAVFVTDETMRNYNRKYRGFDKPTDVLSFPGDGEYLGDIVISVDTAYRQARNSPTLTLDTNIRRLLLHGFLHLLGYDHETDNGEMRTMERRLRRRYTC